MARKYRPGMTKAEFLAVCKAKYSSSIVSTAIKKGVIERDTCIVCNSAAHAHHPDYSKPLDIIWLCAKHHRDEHRRVGYGHKLGLSNELTLLL